MLQGHEIIPIRQSEIHPIGMYCGQRCKGDEIIDWHQTNREIFNQKNSSMLCIKVNKIKIHFDASQLCCGVVHFHTSYLQAWTDGKEFPWSIGSKDKQGSSY